MPIIACPECNGKVSATAEACPHCGHSIRTALTPVGPPAPGARFCHGCGARVATEAVICVKCGVALAGGPATTGTPASKGACAVLALLVPVGIHRFLMGYSTEGILQLVLAPFLVGILWSWVDFILILNGSLKMKDGRPLA